MSYKINKGKIILFSQDSFRLLHLVGKDNGHRNPTPTAESNLCGGKCGKQRVSQTICHAVGRWSRTDHLHIQTRFSLLRNPKYFFRGLNLQWVWHSQDPPGRNSILENPKLVSFFLFSLSSTFQRMVCGVLKGITQ